jgi:hypothetical protein
MSEPLAQQLMAMPASFRALVTDYLVKSAEVERLRTELAERDEALARMRAVLLDISARIGAIVTEQQDDDDENAPTRIIPVVVEARGPMTGDGQEP